MRLHPRFAFQVGIASLAVGLLVGAAMSKRTEHAEAQSSTAAEHWMVGGYWRLDHTFEPALIITNFLENSKLAVSPLLYAADGTEYSLPTVTLGPSGVTSIDIRTSLSEAPADIRSHFSQFGSAAFKYPSTSSNVATGMIQNRDAKRSLNFNSELRTPMTIHNGLPLIMHEGLWWKEDAGVNGFLAVMNTIRHPRRVHVRVLSEYGAFESERSIELQAKETRNLELLEEVKGTSGGIQVSYEGTEGDVMIAGGLENPREGYSAQIPFLTPSAEAKPSIIAISSVGLMFGNPDPAMKFPSGTDFGIYLSLRNITGHPISVTPTLYYMQGTGVQSTTLKALHLGAGQARHWTAQELSKELSLPNLSGVMNVVFSYPGGPSDVIMANGSIDQTRTFVFEANMKAVGKSQAKALKDWDVANGNATMISLLNLDEKKQDLVVTLFFDGGRYKFPVHLESGGSTMINVGDIISTGQPDSDGNKIPANTSHGTATLSGNAGFTEIINVGVGIGVLNVSTATCGNRCPTCFGFSAFKVQVDKGTVAVGQTAQFSSWAFSQNGVWVSATLLSSWTSDNIQVAKPGGTVGGFIGVSAGSFHAHAQANLIDVHADCGATGSPCPFTPYSGSAPGTIYNPVPTSLSIVAGTDSTSSEAQCIVNSGGQQFTGCGVTRSFTYQVNDQNGVPMQVAGLPVWDSFGGVSPNPLAISGFLTTCTPANTGPCGLTTNSAGQFQEKQLSVCSTVCFSKGTCTTGGPSVVGQTWHVGLGVITQPIQYFCNKVTVNGK
jgi:hypothetical protein